MCTIPKSQAAVRGRSAEGEGSAWEVEIRRAGELVLVTTNLDEARNMLEQLGVDDPLDLLKAASRWGAAEIREQPTAALAPLALLAKIGVDVHVTRAKLTTRQRRNGGHRAALIWYFLP